MKPELIENCPKMKPRGAKWTKKQPSGAKWTKNGAKRSKNSKQIAQDGPRQRRRAAQEAQPGLWCTAGAPKWRPKSTKIDEKNHLKIDHFLDHFSYRFFFDFRTKSGRKMIEKSIKK